MMHSQKLEVEHYHRDFHNKAEEHVVQDCLETAD
jgi:hypothetical protein